MKAISPCALACALTSWALLALACPDENRADAASVPDATSADRMNDDSSVNDAGVGQDQRVPDAQRDDAAHAHEAGHAAPGCADAADPTLTTAEQTLLGLPADSWYQATGTHLHDVCSPVSSYGDGIYLTSGCDMIVNAWGGGAYDAQRQRMLVWGGGHADYGGNEVYALDLKSMTWLQLTDPSPPPFGQDPLADGNPVSRHTYDGVEYLAHRDTLLGWGGARSPDGNGTDVTWEFDLAAATWTNRHATPPRYSSPYDFGFAYDPVGHKVYLHSHAVLSVYDPDANQWSELADFGYPPYSGIFDSWVSRTGAFDPLRRLFVSAGAGARMLVYQVDDQQVLALDGAWSSVTGGDGVLGRGAPGIDFDSAAQQLIAWSGGAPYALDADAKRWVEHSALGAPAAQCPNGTYGRWRYAARYNVFVLVNSPTDDVVFYKHTAGCGP